MPGINTSPYTLTIKCCAVGGATGFAWDVKGKVLWLPSKLSIIWARVVHLSFTCSYEIPGLRAMLGEAVVLS